MAEETVSKNIHHAPTEVPPSLPLLPLKNVVILPKSINPIMVGRQLSIKAVEHALSTDNMLFITSQVDPKTEEPVEKDLFTYGTRATILQVIRMPSGALKILAEGLCRARMLGCTYDNGFISAKYIEIPTTNLDHSVEIEALWRELTAAYIAYTQYNDKAPSDLVSAVKNPHDMDYITDMIAFHIPNLNFDDRQLLLELSDLKERMFKLCELIKKEITILHTEQQLRGRFQTQVEKNQREYYLTEQMKAIQKELGRDDQTIEVDTLRKKASACGLSEEAREKVEKEIQRLEQMPPLSSEAVVTRNYIDWILSIPWTEYQKDTISITQASRILDKSHAGLKKLKERVLEFLAAKKFHKNLKRSPIICLVGPPGVGKTSLARSIAESMNRDFVRISLGGIRDEAEIRGHRRTYIGALPGKIIQAMKKAKSLNPVILLDEVDKMSRDIHGDPAAALLEVLDPEQNKGFVDHFLDVEYDLSQVMFITTANMLDHIPYPLLDRLEILSLSGYTEEEKVSIAKKFLIPRNLQEYGLKKQQCIIDETIIRLLVNEYTKEAGVRQLDRHIATIMRKAIQLFLQEKDRASVTVSPELIKEWLGHPTFKKTTLNSNKNRTGLAIGLAWTEVGGDILEIETTVLPGKGSLTLTGQLGEVMQESAHAALSYIRSRAQELGLKNSFHASKDIHIHIPEGATPKDGPSAGITIATALVSALTKQSTKPHIAMTGEITLQGRVLAVGGLKEKLLAAKHHGITTVLVPQENADDIEEIKKDVTFDNFSILFVKSMDEVLEHACIANPLKMATLKNRKRKSSSKRVVQPSL
ncbi:MAG TPA: endopeptidase La [Candidatus Bathyarchaeia archaeon]|nr:endopeptidase La [Candidatus Bathyarchaeia archaeon]